MPYKDPEKHRAAMRRWYARNRDREANKRRQWHKDNRDKSRQLSRAYYHSHKAEVLERQAVRKRQISDYQDGVLDWKAILMGDPCCYCGSPTEEIDHIVPVICGGSHSWQNLTAACRRCNRSKYTKSLLEHLLCL